MRGHVSRSSEQQAAASRARCRREDGAIDPSVALSGRFSAGRKESLVLVSDKDWPVQNKVQHGDRVTFPTPSTEIVQEVSAPKMYWEHL